MPKVKKHTQVYEILSFVFNIIKDYKYIIIKNIQIDVKKTIELDILTDKATFLKNIINYQIKRKKDFAKDIFYKIIKKNNGHYHFDVYFINFRDYPSIRFDIIEPNYCFKKFNLKNIFFDEIFYTKRLLEIKKIKSNIYVPSEDFSNLIKYYEFIDKFDIYPSKYKHFEYLFKSLDEEKLENLINDSHFYIKIGILDNLNNFNNKLQLFFINLRRKVKIFFNIVFKILKKLIQKDN